MSVVEELGEKVRLGGFEVPDLTQEPAIEYRTWFTVVLGAGNFAVRASSEDYALFKAEIRAQELRSTKRPIETNDGSFPLVSAMNSHEAACRSAAMFDSKPEAELASYIEYPEFPKTPITNSSNRPYDKAQMKIFEI